jgi:hypothetical protein
MTRLNECPLMASRATMALALLICFVSGCANSWDARVGKYTYAMVTEEKGGRPITHTRKNGDFVAEWARIDPGPMIYDSSRGILIRQEVRTTETFIFDSSYTLKGHVISKSFFKK